MRLIGLCMIFASVGAFSPLPAPSRSPAKRVGSLDVTIGKSTVAHPEVIRSIVGTMPYAVVAVTPITFFQSALSIPRQKLELALDAWTNGSYVVSPNKDGRFNVSVPRNAVVGSLCGFLNETGCSAALLNQQFGSRYKIFVYGDFDVPVSAAGSILDALSDHRTLQLVAGVPPVDPARISMKSTEIAVLVTTLVMAFVISIVGFTEYRSVGI